MNSIPQPTIKSLLITCLSSLLLAMTIFVIAILPAEFNIDPTGLGGKLGLTVLAQSPAIKEKPKVIACPQIQVKQTDQNRQDTVIISLPAGQELEYKFMVEKAQKMEFSWHSNQVKLYFDFHGEPRGNTTGYFKSYQENTADSSSGTLLAPFTGTHGWYWKNESKQNAVIVLKTLGNYKIKGLM